MPRPVWIAAFLLIPLASCDVGAQPIDSASCYEDGLRDATHSAAWQSALAAQDAALMSRLAGNWSNGMSAFIDNTLSRVLFEQSFAANGAQSSRSTTCAADSDGPCRLREASGTWAARQNSDGSITLATRDDVGERPGFCILLNVKLMSDNQLVFAGTDGDYLTRN